MSWFSSLKAQAGDIVKSFDGSADSSKKIFGVLGDVKSTLEQTMNSAGKRNSGDQSETNLDAGDTGPPWALSQPSLKAREGELKELILQITLGEEKEVMERMREPPPPESDFDFDFEKDTSKAMAALQADSRLQRLRFLLVPSRLREEVFWRNYLFKVDQIKRAFLLGIKLTKSTPAAEKPELRYPDQSDNIDEIGGAEFASDDVVNVNYSSSIAHQSSGSSSSSSAVIVSSNANFEANINSNVSSSESAQAEDWELEMRRELEFDMPVSNAAIKDNSLSALSDEIEKELAFD